MPGAAPGSLRRILPVSWTRPIPSRPVWRVSLVADTDLAIGRPLERGLRPEGFGVRLEYTAAAVLDHVLARLQGVPNVAPSRRTAAVVRRLRRKLDLTAEGAARLLAVLLVGYRLVVPGHVADAEVHPPP